MHTSINIGAAEFASRADRLLEHIRAESLGGVGLRYHEGPFLDLGDMTS